MENPKIQELGLNPGNFISSVVKHLLLTKKPQMWNLTILQELWMIPISFHGENQKIQEFHTIRSHNGRTPVCQMLFTPNIKPILRIMHCVLVKKVGIFSGVWMGNILLPDTKKI